VNVLSFPRSQPPQVDPLIANVRALRVAIRISPFITDGDTRTMLLGLVDAIVENLDAPHPAAEGRV
jgi:hypothetical protein